MNETDMQPHQSSGRPCMPYGSLHGLNSWWSFPGSKQLEDLAARQEGVTTPIGQLTFATIRLYCIRTQHVQRHGSHGMAADYKLYVISR